ncbi:MAG: hypothetical protein OSB21_00445 [Myxococcota bacterium]|nr:hypothetical protein [Myxococcota bacterium]
MRCPVALSFIWDEDSGPPPLPVLAKHLQRYSPDVAWCSDQLSSLWLESFGMQSETSEWLLEVQTSLCELTWPAAAVWGCTPYAASLLAQRMKAGEQRSLSLVEQPKALAALPLSCLNLGASAELSLARLGLHQLGDLQRLPRNALRDRYGEALSERLAWLGGSPLNWQHFKVFEPLRIALPVAEGTAQLEPLLFAVKSYLGSALEDLARRALACSALRLEAVQEGGVERVFSVRPARPSLDEVVLLDLLRLHLEASRLLAPLERVDMLLEGLAAPLEQLRLFSTFGADARRGDEGLDRLRAELGENRLYRAEVRRRHHPKEAARWHQHSGVWPAYTEVAKSSSWVRRLLAEPQLVEAPKEHSSWVVSGESVVAVGGPYPLQQGWWRNPLDQDEYLLRMQSGRLLWLLNDRLDGRWWLIGWVA